LLLEIGIVGVGMVVVDAAIGSHRLGHGRQAYQTGITKDAERAFFSTTRPRGSRGRLGLVGSSAKVL
jgi:hypothetical protein